LLTNVLARTWTHTRINVKTACWMVFQTTGAQQSTINQSINQSINRNAFIYRHISQRI